MQKSEEGNPRIELDLETVDSDRSPRPPRNRPIEQHPMPSAPKIEPSLREGDIGTDEADQTVAIFFLLSAVPGIISMLAGKGFGGILGIAIPIYFGLGLLRGDDFVKEWVKAACLIQIALGPISLLISHGSILYILGGLAQSVGLLILVSANGLSKRNYHLCLVGVAIGILVGIVAPLLH
jgi:hypothetical protein